MSNWILFLRECRVAIAIRNAITLAIHPEDAEGTLATSNRMPCPTDSEHGTCPVPGCGVYNSYVETNPVVSATGSVNEVRTTSWKWPTVTYLGIRYKFAASTKVKTDDIIGKDDKRSMFLDAEPHRFNAAFRTKARKPDKEAKLSRKFAKDASLWARAVF